MTALVEYSRDANLDLSFERVVDVAPAFVWAAWTRPALLTQWFTPAPWTTVEAEIDLRPGGMFRTVMRSPEGQDFPNIGCYLEVVANRRLAWTNALGPGYRPTVLPDDGSCDSFGITAVLTLEAQGSGTRYRAEVFHADERGRKQHEAMGFEDGWGKALDQLVALARSTGGRIAAP